MVPTRCRFPTNRSHACRSGSRAWNRPTPAGSRARRVERGGGGGAGRTVRLPTILSVTGGAGRRLALLRRTGESCIVAAAPPTVGLHEDLASIVSALVTRARIVTGMD